MLSYALFVMGGILFQGYGEVNQGSFKDCGLKSNPTNNCYNLKQGKYNVKVEIDFGQFMYYVILCSI